jgi:hypothetical protein
MELKTRTNRLGRMAEGNVDALTKSTVGEYMNHDGMSILYDVDGILVC